MLHFPKELLIGGTSLPRSSSSQSDSSDSEDQDTLLLHPLNNNFLSGEPPIQESSHNNTTQEVNANYMSDSVQDEDPPGYSAQKSNNQNNLCLCEVHCDIEFSSDINEKQITHEVQQEQTLYGAEANALQSLDDHETANACHETIPHCHSYPHIVKYGSIKQPDIIPDISCPNFSPDIRKGDTREYSIKQNGFRISSPFSNPDLCIKNHCFHPSITNSKTMPVFSCDNQVKDDTTCLTTSIKICEHQSTRISEQVLPNHNSYVRSSSL